MKAIEHALGCSRRQAQRIVETGQVPRAFYAQVVAFLRQSSEYNHQRLAEMDAEIEKLEQAAQAQAQAGDPPGMGGDR